MPRDSQTSDWLTVTGCMQMLPGRPACLCVSEHGFGKGHLRGEHDERAGTCVLCSMPRTSSVALRKAK